MTTVPEAPTEVLDALASAIHGAVGDDLAGLYVYGSYVSGGFDPDGSDLDLVAILEREVGPGDLASLRAVHDNLLRRYPSWSNRLDVVYVGRGSLRDFRSGRGSFAVISPGDPFHLRTDLADWLQSWFLLRETSQPLFGVVATEFVPAISRDEFIAALTDNLEDLRSRAQGQLAPGFLAYIVLTHCRALMTVRTGAGPSKVAAAAWSAELMPEWAWLIDAAIACRHSGGRQGFDDATTREAASRFLDVVADAIRRPVPAHP